MCGMRTHIRDPLQLVKDYVAKAGSQTAAARTLGVSVPYLNDILHGRRKLSDRFLEKLGLTRVVVAQKRGA